jgi:hypothetical protein
LWSGAGSLEHNWLGYFRFMNFEFETGDNCTLKKRGKTYKKDGLARDGRAAAFFDFTQNNQALLLSALGSAAAMML